MRHYLDSAKRAGTWSVIKSNRPPGHLDAAVERWLKSDGVATLSANTLDLANAALLYVCRKVLHAAGIAFVVAGSTTLTILDRLAIFLAKAVELTVDLGRWVYYLMRKLASLIGVVVTEGATLTASFIRMVFTRLQSRVNSMVQGAGREPR